MFDPSAGGQTHKISTNPTHRSLLTWVPAHSCQYTTRHPSLRVFFFKRSQAFFVPSLCFLTRIWRPVPNQTRGRIPALRRVKALAPSFLPSLPLPPFLPPLAHPPLPHSHACLTLRLPLPALLPPFFPVATVSLGISRVFRPFASGPQRTSPKPTTLFKKRCTSGQARTWRLRWPIWGDGVSLGLCFRTPVISFDCPVLEIFEIFDFFDPEMTKKWPCRNRLKQYSIRSEMSFEWP